MPRRISPPGLTPTPPLSDRELRELLRKQNPILWLSNDGLITYSMKTYPKHDISSYVDKLEKNEHKGEIESGTSYEDDIDVVKVKEKKVKTTKLKKPRGNKKSNVSGTGTTLPIGISGFSLSDVPPIVWIGLAAIVVIVLIRK